MGSDNMFDNFDSDGATRLRKAHTGPETITMRAVQGSDGRYSLKVTAATHTETIGDIDLLDLPEGIAVAVSDAIEATAIGATARSRGSSLNYGLGTPRPGKELLRFAR